MKELFELLNNTSQNRVIFYSIIFIISLVVISVTIVEIIKACKE